MNKLLLVLTLLLLVLPQYSHAQATTPMPSANTEVSVNADNIEQLIKTLESETARKEFIDNLKTLKDAADNQDGEKSEEKSAEETEAAVEDAALSLTDKLGLDSQTESFIASYEQFLEDTNLNSSTVGKLILSLLAFTGMFVLFFINQKFCFALRNRLLKLKDKYSLTHDRFRIYARFLRYSGYVLIGCLFIFTLLTIWDLSGYGFLTLDQTKAITMYALNIIFVLALALLLWEGVNSVLEYSVGKMDAEQCNRIQTLMPIIRNILFMVFVVIFTLILLSEIGINILPLLAGAGIFGIAVGFGAQTMVKDFLTGFIIIMEDLIQVGDVAKVGDRIGLVEKVTVRKVQLRDLAGIVYTVPFSEISIIENYTKEFSYYILDVGVAYREDTDEVVGLLREIDEEMREDDNFKDLILSPIEILGVDQFADSAVVIKARIKTRPIKQWDVGREFNRRMKYKFDEHGVEIPFPHQTIYFGEDKEGNAPAGQIMLQQEKAQKKKALPKKKKKVEEPEPEIEERDGRGDNG